MEDYSAFWFVLLYYVNALCNSAFNFELQQVDDGIESDQYI